MRRVIANHLEPKGQTPLSDSLLAVSPLDSREEPMNLAFIHLNLGVYPPYNWPALTSEGMTSTYGRAAVALALFLVAGTSLILPAYAQVETSLTTKLSSSSITAGQSVYDTATLVLGSDTGGGITWYYSTSADCTSPGTTFGTPYFDTVTGSGDYVSGSQTFAVADTYYVYAIYDPSSGPSISSGCEKLIVTTGSVPQFPIAALSPLLLIGLLLPALLLLRKRTIPIKNPS